MFICLANTPYFCYNDIVYFDERGYLLMDKNEYCHIQNIISQYLSKDTRVMDLRCGYHIPNQPIPSRRYTLRI